MELSRVLTITYGSVYGLMMFATSIWGFVETLEAKKEDMPDDDDDNAAPSETEPMKQTVTAEAKEETEEEVEVEIDEKESDKSAGRTETVQQKGAKPTTCS